MGIKDLCDRNGSPTGETARWGDAPTGKEA